MSLSQVATTISLTYTHHIYMAFNLQLITMQEVKLRKGPWLDEEDDRLAYVVSILGDRRWDALAKASGNN